MTLNDEISRRVRQAMDRRGLEAKQFAHDVGLSTGHLSMLRKGQRRWYADALFRVAQVLGVPIGQLFPDDTAIGEELSVTDEDGHELVLYRRPKR